MSGYQINQKESFILILIGKVTLCDEGRVGGGGGGGGGGREESNSMAAWMYDMLHAGAHKYTLVVHDLQAPYRTWA